MSDSSEASGGNFYRGNVDAKGGGVAFGLDIGGALSPGFILAGSFAFQSLPNANLSNDTRVLAPGASAGGGNTLSRNPQVSLLAVMLDFYPDPKQGFHVGGGLGLSSLAVRGDSGSGNNDDSRNGFGFMPHVGYEWWVGNYWGVGVLGRFLYTKTKGDTVEGGSEKDSVVATSVSFSATYN
jgi:hypothetical protein